MAARMRKVIEIMFLYKFFNLFIKISTKYVNISLISVFVHLFIIILLIFT